MQKISVSLLLLLFSFDQPLALPTINFQQQDAAKNIQTSDASAIAKPLSNRDVSAMIKEQLTAEVVIAKIKSFACQFDTSPAALQQLKAGGVPDAVILAMVLAPQVAPAQTSPMQPHDSSVVAPSPQPLAVQLPAGTFIDVEAAHTISSQAVRKGDLISFRVVNPVQVKGVLVIAPGATATAIVTQASRGGHFGRAGRLAWEIQEVTAVDGTRIPLQFSGRTVGDSKGAKVATQTVLTGILLGPAAPLALLSGFKRGENAYLPEGQRFVVSTQGERVIKAAAPR
ncbi:MAG: hypothetical protein H0T63_09240 [Pyrinomonadaceae bacterium]|nr:hypothetical protein [Pyrinomonadaceae bacterium]